MRLVHGIACLACLSIMPILMACSRSFEAGSTVSTPDGHAPSEQAVPRGQEYEDAQGSPPPSKIELPRSEEEPASPPEEPPPQNSGTAGADGATGSAGVPQDRPPAGPVADVREPPPPPPAGPRTR